MFKGDFIFLRAPEPADALQILSWENNMNDWQVSGTEIPFSLQNILDSIDNNQHFRATGQMRLLVCEISNENPIGIIDFYHANFKQRFTSIGILICEEKRKMSFAKDALVIALNYLSVVFDFKNVFANIHSNNLRSLSLFEQIGFYQIGIRKNCYKFDNSFIDEIILQLEIKEK